MKTYTFLCKQNQESKVCRILTENVGKPSASRYNGERGVGIMVTLPVPKNWSKRKIDQLLFSSKIPGARSRKNKYPVIKGERWDKYTIVEKIGANTPFIFIDKDQKNPKMVKAEVYYHSFGCTCCGGYWEFEEL